MAGPPHERAELRALHVIPAVAPRYGGPSQAVLQMSRALQHRGVKVLVATSDADGAGTLPVPLAQVAPYEGVPAIFFRRTWSEAFKYSTGLARWLQRHVTQHDVVHVHAVFSHSSVAASRACIAAGVPYVLRPLGSLDPWSLSQKAWRKRAFWRLWGGRMAAHAAAIHYTSADERLRAERALGLDRGVVIPLGVEVGEGPTDAHRAAPGTPYVLSVGRLHPKKNLESLIEAFRALGPGPWRLVIAGRGEPEYEARLRALANSGAPGRVEFVGWVEGAAKTRLLAGAALFAMPSFQENFGIAAAEAMALGVPVLLSTDVNLSPEVAEAGAGWVVAPEREALRAALAAALAAPEELAQRGRAAARLVEQRYRWSAVAAELHALYDRIARGGGRGRGATS